MMGQSVASRLSEVDREILDMLQGAEDEDGNYAMCLGADIASYVGVPGSTIGSRLRSLREMGFVESRLVPNASRLLMWGLTEAAIRGEFEWR